MFIIITPEETERQEFELLTKFVAFDKVYIHIRKPKATEAELTEYLQRLPKEILQRSSLHSHHQLAMEFALRGVHFTTQQREQSAERLGEEIEYWHSKEKQVSASLHALEEVTPMWDYAFLSPIFDSVSKKDYSGKHFRVNEKTERLIALGGITTDNIKEAKYLGFRGVAVLGNIWKNKCPLAVFKEMYNEYRKHFA